MTDGKTPVLTLHIYDASVADSFEAFRLVHCEKTWNDGDCIATLLAAHRINSYLVDRVVRLEMRLEQLEQDKKNR